MNQNLRNVSNTLLSLCQKKDPSTIPSTCYWLKFFREHESWALKQQLIQVHVFERLYCLSLSTGNPLLLNSSMQPDLTVGRAYSTSLCFHDSVDKELFDPLPDIKVKVQSSFMVSLGVAERAEFHNKMPAKTFPHDLGCDYCGTVDSHKNGLLTLNGPFTTSREQLKTSGVFSHVGGRLLVPNTGIIKRCKNQVKFVAFLSLFV